MILAMALAAAVTVSEPAVPRTFEGFGFQHSEASMTALMSDEFRDERALKSFAEIRPSFGRVYIGFDFSTKEMMDRFADYYDATFRTVGTTLYAVPCAMIPEFPDRTDPDEYAEKVARALEYLVKVRRCDRIRYYCLTNELVVNGKWNWFAKSGRMDLYIAYNRALDRAFRRHGLDILLLATDIAVTTRPKDAIPSLEWAAQNLDDCIGVYCSHWYVYARKTEDLGLWKEYQPYFADLVRIAEAKGKRFLLGEWGFHPAWGKPGVMIDDVSPYRRCPSNRTETVLAKMEVGLAAMNRGAVACVDWSFCDYPDPWVFEDGDTPAEHAAYESAKCVWTPDFKYNKCGLFSWGTVDRDYASCEELYAMGYLAKLFRGGATVLDVTTDDDLLRCGAVRNPGGSLSVVLINRGVSRSVEVSVGKPGTKSFRIYTYDSANVPWNAFNDLQPPTGVVAASEGRVRIEIPAKSMTFLTTDYVDRTPPEVRRVRAEGGRLVWDPVDDPFHAYYRVYANGRQIASTVATRCDRRTTADGVQVLSVDRWGNCRPVVSDTMAFVSF